jgi:hypothetical protein
LADAKISLANRRHAYREVFKGPLAEDVLKDLAKFCRAHESTFHVEQSAHALAEGRREVWLRIAYHLNLSPDDLWRLYTGRTTAEDYVQG